MKPPWIESIVSQDLENSTQIDVLKDMDVKAFDIFS
jgi:hypothetical protein